MKTQAFWHSLTGPLNSRSEELLADGPQHAGSHIRNAGLQVLAGAADARALVRELPVAARGQDHRVLLGKDDGSKEDNHEGDRQ